MRHVGRYDPATGLLITEVTQAELRRVLGYCYTDGPRGSPTVAFRRLVIVDQSKLNRAPESSGAMTASAS